MGFFSLHVVLAVLFHIERGFCSLEICHAGLFCYGLVWWFYSFYRSITARSDCN